MIQLLLEIKDRKMPDGDKVHSKLKLRYQNPYKELCQGIATSSECARSVLKRLKKTLQEQGNHPIRLAQVMSDSLQQAIEASGETGPVSWSDIETTFDNLVQKADSSHKVKELALRAGRVVLHDYRYRTDKDVENASALIIKQYMRETYESEFKERIPLLPKDQKHYAGIDEATLVERVRNMDPDISAAIHKWAHKVNATGRVEDIRMPRQPKQKPVGLDDNLLCA